MEAFISYSSKDNLRFVEKFADKIRDSGIEVWKDTQENINVDLTNIIRKIYEVDIFIVILSKNSINSKWVNEEINVAMTRKIEEGLRIFPVVLVEDDFEVPIVLRHIIQYHIEDINDYDDKFNDLIEDIFNISKKSPLAVSPTYSSFKPIGNLSKSDSIVIKSLIDAFINKNYRSVDFESIVQLLQEYDLSDDVILESLEVLNNNGIVTYKKYIHSNNPVYIKLTPQGMMVYGKHYIDNFDNLVMDISSEIVGGDNSLDSIVEKLGVSRFFAESYFKYLENNGYVKLYCTTSGSCTITKILAEGRRYFKHLLR